MGFQILNDKKEALSLNQLDEEVAVLWNKQVDPKQYATPNPKKEGDLTGVSEGVNWFDSLGFKIHTQRHLSSVSWSTLISEYYADAGKMSSGSGAKYEVFCLIYRPYFSLIDHWATKGYTAIRVED